MVQANALDGKIAKREVRVTKLSDWANSLLHTVSTPLPSPSEEISSDINMVQIYACEMYQIIYYGLRLEVT